MQTQHGKHFLVFTKKEKRGIFVVLFFVLLVFVSSKYIYPLITKEKPSDEHNISVLGDSLRELQRDSAPAYYPHNNYAPGAYHSYPKKEYGAAFTGTMFYFDPNTLDMAGWERLGIKDKTIATIQNYLSKGGKFREPDDLRKIWGLRDDEKDRLVPYARIPEQPKAFPAYSNNYQPYEKKSFDKRSAAPVEINSGDSTAFVGLPGIGPGYSRRIINFRNKLGGFYSIDQVAETFGLPDSVFQKIKSLLKISGDVAKLNINTATNDELKAHPYIRWQLANLITEYKKQHGNFKSLDELKKIPIVDADLYNKLIHYLTL